MTHAFHHADQIFRKQVHPLWISEGLALVFETSCVQDGRLHPLPNARWIQLREMVAQEELIPWAKMVRLTDKKFNADAINSYAQTRYVFLYLHHRGLLKSWYDAYTRGYNDDPTGRAALEKVFGKKLSEIEADWMAWVKSQKPTPSKLQPGVPCLGFAYKRTWTGLLIRDVLPSGGAEQAGLKVNDLVTRVDGQHVASYWDMMAILSQYHPGDTLKVAYRRNGQSLETAMSLRAAPDTGGTTNVPAAFCSLQSIASLNF